MMLEEWLREEIAFSRKAEEEALGVVAQAQEAMDERSHVLLSQVYEWHGFPPMDGWFALGRDVRIEPATGWLEVRIGECWHCACWPHERRGVTDLRVFLAEASADYVAAKLQFASKEFDCGATVQGVKEAIIELRREPGRWGLTREQARNEWDAITALGEDEDVQQWLKVTDLGDAWEYVRERDNQALVRFRARWVELGKELKVWIAHTPLIRVDPGSLHRRKMQVAQYHKMRALKLESMPQEVERQRPFPRDDLEASTWDDVEWPEWVPEGARRRCSRSGRAPAELFASRAVRPGALVVPSRTVCRMSPAWGWWVPELNGQGLVVQPGGRYAFTTVHEVMPAPADVVGGGDRE